MPAKRMYVRLIEPTESLQVALIEPQYFEEEKLIPELPAGRRRPAGRTAPLEPA